MIKAETLAYLILIYKCFRYKITKVKTVLFYNFGVFQKNFVKISVAQVFI